MALGLGVLNNQQYFTDNCKRIAENRDYTISKLKDMGFFVLPSKANFIFIKKEGVDGEYMYKELKKKGVLVRYFSKERVKDFIRVSIGTKEEMDVFLSKLNEILEEK